MFKTVIVRESLGQRVMWSVLSVQLTTPIFNVKASPYFPIFGPPRQVAHSGRYIRTSLARLRPTGVGNFAYFGRLLAAEIRKLRRSLEGGELKHN